MRKSMRKSMKILYLLPLLIHEARSSFLRTRSDNNGASLKRSRSGSSITPSIRRVSPQRKLQDKFDYYECSPNIVQYQSVVFIEFNNDLTNLTDSARQALEDGFKETFNSLVNSFCDVSYHRSVVSATLEWPPRRRLSEANPLLNQINSFGGLPNNNGNTTFVNDKNDTLYDHQIVSADGTLLNEKPQAVVTDVARFFISVQCHDCPSNASLFTLPNGTSSLTISSNTLASITQSRTGAQSPNSCTCLAESESGIDAPFRAPTAAEFQAAFNETVGSLNVEGVLQELDVVEDLVEVDVVNCSSNVQQFSSNVIANLEGDIGLLTPQERSALELGFKDTYNRLTFTRCDRYFRQILEVQLISTEDRRRLLGAVESNATVYSNATNSSLVFYNETEPPANRVVPAVYRVFGECRGCPVSRTGSFSLFDDVSLRRSLEEAATAMFAPPPAARYGRDLLGEPDDVCLCPPNSQPTDPQAPSDKEFEQEYSATVEQLQDEGVVVNVGSVDNVQTDNEVCSRSLEQETGYYIVKFAGELKDGPSLGRKLEEAFRAAYRSLGRDVCGPLLSDVDVVEENRDSNEIVFEVESLQTFAGSIFLNSQEESIFVESLNENLSDERINSQAEGIKLGSKPTSPPTPSPTAAPSRAPIPATNGTTVPQPTVPTAVPPANSTLAPQPVQPTAPPTSPPTNATEEKGGEGSQPPSTKAPVTPVPTQRSSPTTAPSEPIAPTVPPTTRPPATMRPTQPPTEFPTPVPTPEPTKQPTPEPTREPTEISTDAPTAEPTARPTEDPTARPTAEPTSEPTSEPTASPTEEPTKTVEPTMSPTEAVGIPVLPPPTGSNPGILPPPTGSNPGILPETGPPTTAAPTTDSPSASPTTWIDNVDNTVSTVIDDVRGKLEVIVGHALPVIEDVTEFLDEVDGELGAIFDSVIPDVPDLSDLLEDVSHMLDELPAIPGVPDMPQTRESIQETIRGILGILRGEPTTSSPTTAPTMDGTLTAGPAPTAAPPMAPTTLPSPDEPTASPSPVQLPVVTTPPQTQQPVSAPPSPQPTKSPTKAKGCKGGKDSGTSRVTRTEKDPKVLHQILRMMT
ncbi:ECF subfamily RNA polymerase sigma-24 subunit [Seminavis robusta]|uniref:ECF subfamily RNA polymerase sigma-24 subunit n=1 Tax=Seminavis robusta TaxID=568900 RepID=A0A9N8DYZ9_9STRA|nr:ECF subfamily RNA polymerase sigma-24 subunit [Seminavis robusta]|eukprot:Sro402_g135430.1 ECF subfamily RNA polymerase sigma-24 subunit (1085) ;mRNA; f:29856-33194